MRGLFLSALFLAAAAALPGVAHAQPGLSTGMNLDGIDNASRIAENTRRALQTLRNTGLEALQKQDFVAAAKAFGDLVSREPTTTDAHFLMGVAKLGQQDWAEAKKFLEIAVREEPKRPDPKARLGVAYVKLNDIDAAMKQRAELASMASKCNGCGDAARIADNLALLDRSLAAAKPQGAAGN